MSPTNRGNSELGKRENKEFPFAFARLGESRTANRPPLALIPHDDSASLIHLVIDRVNEIITRINDMSK